MAMDVCGVCGGDNSSCSPSGICRVCLVLFMISLFVYLGGVCGDGYCNTEIGETCTNCGFDCGNCRMFPSTPNQKTKTKN
jgi:hypothetical protein